MALVKADIGPAADRLNGLEKVISSFVGNPNFVLSLARGLKVIEAFDKHTEGLSIADVSRKTGFSRAATRRLLLTLQMLDYVEEKGRIFRLKTPVLRLGFSYLSSASLPSLAQPVLESLTEILHESTSLSVMDGDEIVYVARSATKRVMSIGLSVGSRLPSYCTSMGRVLLAGFSEERFSAYLDRIILNSLTPKTITDKSHLADVIKHVRTDGYALVDEELELGLRSIAVPISTSQGGVIAAMNVGAHAGRTSAVEMIGRILPNLRSSATSLGQTISAALG
jgi:IclR family transcriptional regulator, pca regulon regulatory protein